jgi:ADP-dependent NAD(P)H-hydrate dehydratase
MKQVTSLPSLPERPTDGHKGTFGRVLIIAGSRGMSGAACLCGKAALRGGSGLVFVATPQSTHPIVAGYEPSYLTLPLAEDETGRIDAAALATLLERSQGMDAIALGPGLGQSTGLRLLVHELYRSLEQPMIVDADGLNLLAKSDGGLEEHAGPRVHTPHIGEFARLCGLSIGEIQADRQEIAGRFAAQHNVTLLLKGPATLITDGQRFALNTTGNSGMGTGGTGDVLTGLIASLLGQGMPAFEAAHLGAFVHGAAGDRAAVIHTERSLIASDLLDSLPDAWHDAAPSGD